MKGNCMKRRPTLLYILAFIGVLIVASLLMAMSSATGAPSHAASNALQATVQPTVIVPTLPAGGTPPAVVVTGTTVAVPVTGGAPLGGSWLFLAILIVAGLAFLVAIFALMRRPY
jgi:hypothetical protein